jgi:hypothetical protein
MNTWVASVIVLGVASTAAAAPPARIDRFTVAGHRVTASLAVDSTKVIVGEPVTLRVTVANTTGDAMWLVVSPEGNGSPDGFTVRVTGPRGPVPRIPPGPAAGNGVTGAGSLPAHGSSVARLLLPEWATIDKPGRYTVTVEKSLRLGVGRGGNWQTQSIRHPIRLAVVLDVRPATRAQLGRVIARLGSKMLAANDEEGGAIANALATIHDARVVPYFVKAVAKKDWSRQFPAIVALGAYPTAASLAALTRALKLPGNGRIAAAQAIAQHRTPAGLKVLWALRTDKDASMRLEVLHALAELDPPDVVAKLTEMSRDRSAMVRGEAKRYLAERAKKRP